MVITFIHWGVHAWAIYAIVGLSLVDTSGERRLPEDREARPLK